MQGLCLPFFQSGIWEQIQGPELGGSGSVSLRRLHPSVTWGPWLKARVGLEGHFQMGSMTRLARSHWLLVGGLCHHRKLPGAPGATRTPRRRVPGSARLLLGLTLFHSPPFIIRSPRGSQRDGDTYPITHAPWRGSLLLTARGLPATSQPALTPREPPSPPASPHAQPEFQPPFVLKHVNLLLTRDLPT